MSPQNHEDLQPLIFVPSEDAHLLAVGDAHAKDDGPGLVGSGECSYNTAVSDVEARERAVTRRKLTWAVALCVLFMCIEIVGGWMCNSLAVLTDAAHLFSDVAGFGVSLFALWMSSWKATAGHTYGYQRGEILGALASILTVWFVTGLIVYEALHRAMFMLEPVDGRLMFGVAAFGVVVNIIMVGILHHDPSSHGPLSHCGSLHSHVHPDHSHVHPHHSHMHPDHSHVHPHHSHVLPHHSHVHPPHDTCTPSEATPDHSPCHNRKKSCTHKPLQSIALSDVRCGHGLVTEFANGHGEDMSEGERETVVDVDSATHLRPHHKHNHHHAHNINLRGAFLHVVGDLVQSVGVMVAGAVIWYEPNWRAVDLVCTFLFSLLVLATTWGMMRDILSVLMECAPSNIDIEELRSALKGVAGVVGVHDLHVWAVAADKPLLSCHLHIQPTSVPSSVLRDAKSVCVQRFGITHVTIQVESPTLKEGSCCP